VVGPSSACDPPGTSPPVSRANSTGARAQSSVGERTVPCSGRGVSRGEEGGRPQRPTSWSREDSLELPTALWARISGGRAWHGDVTQNYEAWPSQMTADVDYVV